MDDEEVDLSESSLPGSEISLLLDSENDEYSPEVPSPNELSSIVESLHLDSDVVNSAEVSLRNELSVVDSSLYSERESEAELSPI